MRKRTHTLPVWGVAALAGLAVGYAIAAHREAGEVRPPKVGPAVSTPAAKNLASSQVPSSSDFRDLKRELEVERRARKSLARELASLRKQIEQNAKDHSAATLEPRAKGADRSRLGSAPPGSDEASPAARALAKQRRERVWFDRSALEQVGYSSSEIDEIKTRFENFEMDKLYLEDQSKRDGTFRSANYKRELANLNTQLRENLGPPGYDAFLYATGKNNRVRVQEVLEDSPAAYAGLAVGDIVLSYAETRVFRPGEFKRATSRGDAGAQVPLEVLRAGELYRLSVPRGPLGIRMQPQREPPLNPR